MLGDISSASKKIEYSKQDESKPTAYKICNKLINGKVIN